MKKIAVITGGSRGLGKAAALALAARKTGVILTYRSQAKAAQEVVNTITSSGGEAVALALDVSQPASFAAFVQQVKAAAAETWQREDIDYLLNNAGHGIHATFAETSESQLDNMYQVHFKGVFLLTQAILPLLADGGRILNVSSGLTRFSFPGYAAYAAMKGAVEVLTRYLAVELGERNIAVNTLAPGAIATDFGGGAVRDNAGLNAALASQTALGRVGEAEDIGPVMAALLSEETHWVNAQRIEASGGMRT